MIACRNLRGRPTAKGRGGFSLAEMLVVLAIISILAGMGMLSYSAYTDGRLVPEGARRITSILTLAREEAIAESKTYQVTLDLPYNSFWIDQTLPTYVPKITTPGRLPDGVSIIRTRADATTVTTGTISITFYPDGTSQSAEITMTEDADDTASGTIKLYGSTGRARTFIEEN